MERFLAALVVFVLGIAILGVVVDFLALHAGVVVIVVGSVAIAVVMWRGWQHRRLDRAQDREYRRRIADAHWKVAQERDAVRRRLRSLRPDQTNDPPAGS